MAFTFQDFLRQLTSNRRSPQEIAALRRDQRPSEELDANVRLNTGRPNPSVPELNGRTPRTLPTRINRGILNQQERGQPAIGLGGETLRRPIGRVPSTKTGPATGPAFDVAGPHLQGSTLVNDTFGGPNIARQPGGAKAGGGGAGGLRRLDQPTVLFEGTGIRADRASPLGVVLNRLATLDEQFGFSLLSDVFGVNPFDQNSVMQFVNFAMQPYLNSDGSNVEAATRAAMFDIEQSARQAQDRIGGGGTFASVDPAMQSVLDFLSGLGVDTGGDQGAGTAAQPELDPFVLDPNLQATF